MIEIPVYESATGAKVEDLQVDEGRLGGQVRKALLRDAILTYETNQHLGTSSTKTRSEVAGSNRKPWRQKGTGRARAGHKRSPIWRGGAVVHGPRPFTHRVRMNRKARRRAMDSALLAKCLEKEIILVDKVECPEIKTKQMADLLDRLELYDTVLILLDSFDESVWKSARNIPGVNVADAREVSVFDLLVSKHILISKEAFLGLLDRGRAQSEGGPEDN